MSNPLVWMKLHFIPEDGRRCLTEAQQASKWLNDITLELVTPMMRWANQDFCVFETALLTDGSFVVPHHWFSKNGEIYVRAWTVRPEMGEDGPDGWLVL